jgi:hypothetical protein
MMITNSVSMKEFLICECILGVNQKADLVPLVTKITKQNVTVSSSTVSDLLDLEHPTSESYAENSELSVIIQSLEEKLVEMAVLIETRSEHLTALTAAVPKSIVSTTSRLLDRFSSSNSGLNSSGSSTRSELITIVDDSVAELTELKVKISSTSHQQDVILKAILNLNESFAKAIANDHKTVERNLVIGKVIFL